jgi:hypothetical protein
MDGFKKRLLIWGRVWRRRLNPVDDGLGQRSHQDVENASFECYQIPGREEVSPRNSEDDGDEDPNDGDEVWRYIRRRRVSQWQYLDGWNLKSSSPRFQFRGFLASKRTKFFLWTKKAISSKSHS